jgi:Apea-like HEPN
MSKFCAVIPLLHRECKLIPNVPLLFDQTTSVRSLKSEHIGAIITKRRALSETLNSKTKCFFIQTGDEETSQQIVETTALCGSFVLNVFAKIGALICEQGFVIKHVRSHSVINVFELSAAAIPTFGKFEIDQNTDPTSVKTLYAGVNEALRKDPSLAITIRRFNSALSKSSYEDKVIDITICLESMFNSQTEISFRFSLYNSILAGNDVESSLVLFRLLKKLYAERSNLVHGNTRAYVIWLEYHTRTFMTLKRIPRAHSEISARNMLGTRSNMYNAKTWRFGRKSF